jgi:GTP cyclohydrolase IB
VRGTFPLPRGVPFKLFDNDHIRRMERSMNMHIATIAGRVEAELAGERPSRSEAEAAARVLLAWAGEDPARDGARDLSELLTDGRTALYPDFNRSYPRDFAPDGDYLATLPDLQNGPESLIKGARTQIQHVGISNFRLPVRYHTRDGGDVTLETSVTGSVSLEADKKGINMSRIMRTFYRHAEKKFSFEVIDAVLEDYLADLGSYDARIQMRFSYPMKKRALRSGLEGYQYYDIALEVVKTGGRTQKIVHLDYVYSSTCPCSLELSEHARRTRRQIATPHSQRSVARVSVEVLGDGPLWFEDVVDLCTAAIRTETQVMVKREDEQAFAELNGSHPIFVEDAVRLLCDRLQGDARIGDFRVVASHQESLHSHDAVSILTSGETFRQTSYDPRLFDTLYHVG